MSASEASTPDGNVTPAGKLHFEVESFQKALEDEGLWPCFGGGLSSEQLNERAHRISELFAGDVEYIGKAKEYRVPTRHVEGGIPVTAYIPKQLGARPAVLVYFHGVGLTWGSRQTVDVLCRTISNDSNCILVNAEYRSLPDHNLLASCDDAVSVLRWVLLNKSLIGATNDSQVGVAGDSGGGMIAATVCHEVPGIKFQILIYPKLDVNTEHKSYDEYEDGPILRTIDIQKYLEEYIDNQSLTDNVRCNPLKRHTFENIPPALFVVPEFDPVKDDAHEYIKLLKSSGVKVTLVPVRGACHGFFHLPGHFKDCSRKAYNRVVHFVKCYSGYSGLNLLT